MENGVTNATPSRDKKVRLIFAIIAWLFAVCVIVQVFIAGMAIFIDADHWRLHVHFIHIFEWLPIIMFILTFIGSIPSALRWQSLGLFALIFIQYATANMGSVGVLPAFHTVIALIMFSWSIAIARRALKN